MNQEEEKLRADKKYALVKEVFFRSLCEMEDLRISLDDAEETFLSLWIFINKKNSFIVNNSGEPADLTTAETFYKFYIEDNNQTREYLGKLLISFWRK